jgi:hypothetical protein
MRKFFIFCIVCCASMMMSAQLNNWAQQLVDNIAADVNISTEQTQQLQIAADEYITAMQQANQQYTDDTERTKAKEVVFKTYQSSLQEILTEEQYTELMGVREERRNQRITQ